MVITPPHFLNSPGYRPLSTGLVLRRLHIAHNKGEKHVTWKSRGCSPCARLSWYPSLPVLYEDDWGQVSLSTDTP